MSSPATPFPGPLNPSLPNPFDATTPWPVDLEFEMVLGSSQFVFPVVYLSPMSHIHCELDVPNYAGTDVICMRLGTILAGIDAAGVEGSTGHYCTRYQTSVAGGVVVADNPFPSGLQVRFGLPTNFGRNVILDFSNIAGKSKVGQFSNQIGTGSAATPATIHASGEFEYVAGDGQENLITAIQFGTFLNAAKMGAGAAIRIRGMKKQPAQSITVG